MEPMWEQNNHIAHQVKYESDAALPGFSYCTENGLNFSTNSANFSEDDTDFAPGRRNKPSRQDPLSHRIIEKRRRDRMNSCLADLSRLIPPQFQRKGRGRIEKTEIIEMSIRYMKQLQNQECLHKENVYKMGYEECLNQAANFLYSTHRELCFQLMDHLKEHSNDFMKADFCKLRNNADSISASSGSPPTNVYHTAAPMNQLRNMLLTDMDHSNSNDHNDVKDLSFRSNQPQQAAVITSTAPIVHLDSSNHDFDSSRASSVHADTEISNEKTDSTTIQSVRVRKLSESSHPDHHHDHHEHHNYKFKNYIQQRFSQDNHADHDAPVINLVHENGSTIDSHDKHASMDDAVADFPRKSSKFYDFAECSSCDEAKPTTNGITEMFTKPNANTNAAARFPHNPVPIFALHSQGRHYIPLNMPLETIVPYLDGYDLIGKNCAQQMPPCHSVAISVNFTPTNRTKQLTNNCNGRTKGDSIVCNGW